MTSKQQQKAATTAAIVQNIATAAVLQTVAKHEERIDNELLLNHQLDSNDTNTNDKELEQLRIKRLQQYQNEIKQRTTYLENGHGTYTELSASLCSSSNNDIVKEFFSITKKSNNVIIHFYKDSSNYICDSYHKHLCILAQQHIETKFIKINVECTLQDSILQTTTNNITYLIEKLNISIMPTIVLIKNNTIIHKLYGFNELMPLNNSTSNNQTVPNFTTANLAYVLGKYGVINCTDDEQDANPQLSIGDKNKKKKQQSKKISGNGIRRSYYNDNDDSDDNDVSD